MPPKKQKPKRCQHPNHPTFPIGEILGCLQKIDKKIPVNVAVHLAASEEYLLAEIIEKASSVARQRGSSEISKADVVEAINRDSALKDLLGKHVEEKESQQSDAPKT